MLSEISPGRSEYMLIYHSMNCKRESYVCQQTLLTAGACLTPVVVRLMLLRMQYPVAADDCLQSDDEMRSNDLHAVCTAQCNICQLSWLHSFTSRLLLTVWKLLVNIVQYEVAQC